MIERSQVIFILVIASLFCMTYMSGCVEVTPPSGQQEAEAYGPLTTTGEIKDLIKSDKSAETSDTSSQAVPSVQETPVQIDNSSPEAAMPTVPNDTLIEVTPRDYQQIVTLTPTSYQAFNRPHVSPERQFVTIYEILNKQFVRNASAYAYELLSPPLYVEIGFYPKMIEDIQEVYKRTGDKEGTIVYKRNRPSQDAWFEMIIYNLDTGQEILREGYGKRYSLANKTSVVRSAGKLQFDFIGNDINADIRIKIPVSTDLLDSYSDVSSLIDQKRQQDGLLPTVFLIVSDLTPGWQQGGDTTHSASQYSSIFIQPQTGSKLVQDINKYSGLDEAIVAYSKTKELNAGERQVTVMSGSEGYGYESIRKTGVVFRQGAYVVQLTSFSVPPVPFTDLKRYASILSARINQN